MSEVTINETSVLWRQNAASTHHPKALLLRWRKSVERVLRRKAPGMHVVQKDVEGMWLGKVNVLEPVKENLGLPWVLLGK